MTIWKFPLQIEDRFTASAGGWDMREAVALLERRHNALYTLECATNCLFSLLSNVQDGDFTYAREWQRQLESWLDEVPE